MYNPSAHYQFHQFALIYMCFLCQILCMLVVMQVGVALKELFSSGVVQRSELFITSKLWYLFHLMLVFNLIYNADILSIQNIQISSA